MHIIKSLIAGTAAILLAIPAAFAEHHEDSMSMISLFEVDPAKAKDFDAAWKDIRDIAVANDYPYLEFTGGSRNNRWIATPVKNYADVDAIYAAREAVSDAGGKKYKRALDKFVGAMTSSHTFFTTTDAELSYKPEAAMSGDYMEIDTYYYDYGAKKELKKILADWKALMITKDIPYGYEVNWDGIGSIGNSITIISTAENAVAMAEQNAAIGAALKDDDDADALLEAFLAINTGSETFHSKFNAEASIMPKAEE